jgi:hypothetical protein
MVMVPSKSSRERGGHPQHHKDPFATQIAIFAPNGRSDWPHGFSNRPPMDLMAQRHPSPTRQRPRRLPCPSATGASDPYVTRTVKTTSPASESNTVAMSSTTAATPNGYVSVVGPSGPTGAGIFRPATAEAEVVWVPTLHATHNSGERSPRGEADVSALAHSTMGALSRAFRRRTCKQLRPHLAAPVRRLLPAARISTREIGTRHCRGTPWVTLRARPCRRRGVHHVGRWYHPGDLRAGRRLRLAPTMVGARHVGPTFCIGTRPAPVVVVALRQL